MTTTSNFPASSLRAIAALASVAVLALGCGGSDGGGGRGEKDVEALLDRAFTTPVSSADLRIDAQLDLDGLAGLKGPIRLEAEGSYVAGKGTLPKLDLDVKGGAPDAGQAIELGLLSTGDRAFVGFGGEFYEQPRADVERANRDLRREEGERSGSLSALGLDPRRWVIEARDEGEQEIEKVATDHVSARLDLKAVLADVNGLAERTGGPQAKGLSAEQLTQAEEVFGDPRFDVYVGEDDSIIRRMSANLEFMVPESQQARLRGVQRGALRISVELSDVNGDQRVRAPAEARPISELASQLGGIGALRGEGGLGSPEGPDGQPGPDEGSELQRYDDCLDRAAPDDTAALSRCSDLLR